MNINLATKNQYTDGSCCSFRQLRIVSICLMVVFLLIGCSVSVKKPDTLTFPTALSSVDKSKPKNIFVFMDGTSNNQTSQTNVYQLYEWIKDNNYDNQSVGIYIDGVGNESTAGKGFGFDMEPRILTGYKFLIHQYQPNDRIYIFGFSRGAHTARSLAGLISYAGIPIVPSEGDEDSRLDSLQVNSGYIFGNKILEKTKKIHDKLEIWEAWKKNKKPPLEAEIAKLKKMSGTPLEIKTQNAEIEFLGVWDTVPGSVFKNEDGVFSGINNKDYGLCKEHVSDDKGERYKLDSYPTIKYIAHAVSNDEKRSMFKPLLLCSKTTEPNSVIDTNYTTLNEVVFPGAHADVGGGYGHKNNQLPTISLKWMLDLLNGKDASGKERYSFSPATKKKIEALKGDPDGLADLSISSKGASVGSHCLDRSSLLKGIKHDDSLGKRNDAGKVPWLYYDIKPPKGVYSDESCKGKVKPQQWPEDKVDNSNPKNVLCIEQSKITCLDLGY